MKYIILITALVTSLNSYADKESRDKRTEIEPILAKSSADFKAACGCNLKINVNWDSYKSASDMNRLPTTAEQISAGSAAYCKNPGDKAAICKMKSLDLSFAKEPTDIKFSKGTMSAQTNDMLHADWDQMTKILDQ